MNRRTFLTVPLVLVLTACFRREDGTQLEDGDRADTPPAAGTPRPASRDD